LAFEKYKAGLISRAEAVEEMGKPDEYEKPPKFALHLLKAEMRDPHSILLRLRLRNRPAP
jgi:hypothetical protein